MGELAGRFGVSEMTIRRDLTLLEKQGFLLRTHGGGVSTTRMTFLQDDLLSDSVSGTKTAIGKLAAGLVEPGFTVMLDAGTTALQVAMNLPRLESLTVATTSLCVAQVLYGSPVQLILLGGCIRRDFPSLYGPVTESMLRGFHVDMLFIGCDGASSTDGFYTVDPHLSNLEQMMIGISDRVVLVAESTKFARRSFARYATPNEIDIVVTDHGIAQQDRTNLEERGVRILIAG